MDFLKEAANCDTFWENHREIKYVTCPKVYHELTTSHIMVMSYIEGIQIDHIGELEEQGYDMTEIGRKAAENYCKQILEDGFFHADPPSRQYPYFRRADRLAGFGYDGNPFLPLPRSL